MSILAHHEGLVDNLLGIPAKVFGVKITVVPDGTISSVAIVERWTCSVQLTNLVIHCLDVRSHCSFVAKAPKNDARMIEVTLDQRFGSIDVRLLPGKVLPHLLIGITVTMRLVIGFVHYVDSPAVAKFVEIFTIGIMRGAQEVDVGLFHQANVLFVGGIVHISTCLRVVIMTVHTAQFDILAVDFEDFANNFHFLDA